MAVTLARRGVLKNWLPTTRRLGLLLALLCLGLVATTATGEAPQALSLDFESPTTHRTEQVLLHADASDLESNEADLTPTFAYLTPSAGRAPLGGTTLGAYVRAMAISANGEYLVTGSDDHKLSLVSTAGAIPLWDYSTGDSVRAVAISANGEYIAAGSDDNNLYLFHRNNTELLWSYPAGDDVRWVSISADGRFIAAATSDRHIYLFHRNSKTPLWEFNASGDMHDLALSGDGRYLAAGAGNKVHLFDRGSGTPRWNYTTSGNINAVAISYAGATIAAGGNDERVYLFGPEDATPRWSYNAGSQVLALATAADGLYLIAGTSDNQVHLFRNDTAQPQHSFDTAGDVEAVAMAADGRYFTAGAREEFSLYDREQSAPLWTYDFGAVVLEVAISADGDYLAAGADNNRLFAFQTWHDDYLYGTQYRSGRWEAAFIPGTGAEKGNYSFRVRFTDPSSAQSGWLYHLTAVEVLNRQPVASIDDIVPNPANEGEAVAFTGRGNDTDGSIIGYRWRTSLGGELRTVASFITATLTAGNHIIYFQVQDNDGRWSAEQQTFLNINELPLATIDLISTHLAHEGQMVSFEGHGNDSDGEVLRYAWVSSIDGVLGDEPEFNLDNLSVGNHTIYFQVQDDGGAWSVADTIYLVINRRPFAVITGVSPSPALYNQTVHFSATATDDGEVTRYLWRSSQDGDFLNTTLSEADFVGLSNTTHLITLLVQDDQGAWSLADPVTLEIWYDSDGDGAADWQDAFPDDPAASRDDDGDGFPDAWAPGHTPDGTGLRLDAFPKDPAASRDSDGDGAPDDWNQGRTARDSTTGLHLDVFPTDPAASIDSDGDGFPDAWNPDFAWTDSTTSLELDAFPHDPSEWSDMDGDGVGDNSDLAPTVPNNYLYGGVALVLVAMTALTLERWSKWSIRGTHRLMERWGRDGVQLDSPREALARAGEKRRRFNYPASVVLAREARQEGGRREKQFRELNELTEQLRERTRALRAKGVQVTRFDQMRKAIEGVLNGENGSSAKKTRGDE